MTNYKSDHRDYMMGNTSHDSTYDAIIQNYLC